MKRTIYILSIALNFLSNVVCGQDPDPPPTANFEAGNLCYGSLTTFTNTSTSPHAPVYRWEIWQNGIAAPIYTAAAVNISFQFPAKTTYTVLLNVTYYITPVHWHADDTFRVLYVDSFPIANFDMKGCQARFTDLSTCCNTYFWDFGDGTTSTQKSPYHDYPNANTYTVTHIAGNGAQSDTMTKTVTPYANLLSGAFDMWMDGDTTRFKSQTDSMKAAFVDWEWDFGDGSGLDIYGAEGWKVRHYFQPAERDTNYVISLHEADACFDKKSSRVIFVKGNGKAINGVTLFPNPVSTPYLSIQCEKKEDLLEIKMFDYLGQALSVESRPYWYGYLVYMDNLAKGVYTVQLIFPDRTEKRKVVKD